MTKVEMLTVLKRRRDFLTDRVKAPTSQGAMHRDAAEASALTWAITICEKYDMPKRDATGERTL